MSSVELFDELEAGELSIQFEGEEPEALLAWAIEEFGDRLAISTSFQADSVALIDMAYSIDPAIKVFSIDTGRLPAETLELADRLRLRYPALDLNLISPEPGEVEGMTGKHGPDLFKTSVDLRLLCCNVRKVRPLTKHLHTLDAWVTGLRRDQWASRTNIRKVEIDHDHGAVIKLNPLAEWTEQEVWDYIRERDVPYHALYDQGFTSIGCAPCTRAVEPGAASRSGRWWWESGAPKECGIHCSVESGGLEHELHALIGEHAD
ncbi:MAG TPA: phosphoadenylyl-sulfate reductase [Gaiellaceae bacterium]|nr:phosphoadenylyl-sulfate reductase [Gaiellaceae bacterium]